MSSPTQGMWACEHGTDGRDFCDECYAPAMEPKWLHEVISEGGSVLIDYENGRTILKDARTGLPLRRYKSRGEEGW